MGERELGDARQFVAPPPTELHDALEDRYPSELALCRFKLGLTAHQLTDLAWHEYWGRP